MPVGGIGGSVPVNNTSPVYTNGSDLGIDDFFKLLSAQLQNQNMFEPTNDTEFISQMAQFSSLQQMQNLYTAFESTFAVSLIDKEVKVSVKNDLGFTEVITGKVDKVLMQNGKSLLSIDGMTFETASVIEVLG